MLILTGFGLGCLVCLFFIILRDFRHQLVGQIFLLILLSATAYLVAPLVPQDWRWIASDLQTAMPGLFWVVCQLIFASRPRFRSVWGFLALYSFVVPALARPHVIAGESSDLAVFFGWELGRWFEYIVVLHALMHVIRHWRADLVESRRRARLAFLLIVGGSVGIATVSLNFGLYHEYSRSIIVSFAALTTLLCFVSAREGILELSPETQTEQAQPSGHAVAPASGATADLENNEDLTALNRLMDEGFYTTEKLTLKRLAESLQIPEYRVRKTINQTLGYRNFNDYINHLRIEDAARRLAREPETPILNISLDVGYRTLSSFNRAFRDIMETTPTEFRLENHPDKKKPPLGGGKGQR
ncbi:helix-turn-helix transcriptional regulator [Marinobacter sp. M216]|uniref:Helix-turn-helix transcriptional regulator n=1 Tax=Marinobacter albus TaxID=3030833 RepID=A0ABT7HEG2_9GAMM|nr:MULTISPECIES: helix-turn-helix transcriptional regulator [unclassified Marinobacter]MBW7472178.1 helix-turn-helix transcriptional regulator [Marinobacter sp. F4218]MDK9558748.1 helix-turn-helix transcriptional regulator [Marinobacter sp. M216]